MWCDELPPSTSWATLWHGYIVCGACSGIRRSEGLCPACGVQLRVETTHIVEVGGREINVPAAHMGAEGRYEDWVYLQLMEREWKRPITEADALTNIPIERRPSARAALVVLFWTYFETRIERLLRAASHAVPAGFVEDAFNRYVSIGSRMDRLYRIVCESTYFTDLEELGFAQIAAHLRTIQQRRNDFAHGNPHAIDDELVRLVVANLKLEHEAWIAVFNKRAARPRK